MLNSLIISRIQDELDTKSTEIDTLTNQISSMRNELEKAGRELNEAKSERSSAVQAKVIAEQKMVSLDYEYEQHQARATRREKELVEQIGNLSDNDGMKQLKEKLKAMTDTVNSLETQLWQSDKKHQTEIDELNERLCQEKLHSKNATKQIDQLKGLQSDYDEVSMQLVDSISENDQLKNKCAGLNESVDKLQSEIDKLKTELAEALSNAQVQSQSPAIKDSEAKLCQQIEMHVIELKSLKESHQMELDGLNQELDSRSQWIQESEQALDVLRKEFPILHKEYEELWTQYDQVVHRNTILENVCAQCRVTIDCCLNEMEVLRGAYSGLQMSQAEQELQNLRLQLTINDQNETINASLFNETVSNSVANSTQVNSSHVNMTPNHANENKNAVLNDLTIQLQKLSEERDDYASQLESIKSTLAGATDDEKLTFQDDLTQAVSRLILISKAFNGIKSFLNANEISVSADPESVTKSIQTSWNRYKDISVAMGDEIK